MMTARIGALNVYPVKSCRGIAVERATVAARGLSLEAGPHVVADREWMIVDGDGVFVTQRKEPRLALIVPRIGSDALELAAAGRAPLRLPFAAAHGVTREVIVWNDRVRADDAGDEAARWLTSFLGAPVRLVRFDATRERRCNPAYVGASGAHTAFADGYPLLVIGEASLADLNARLVAKGAAPLPMNRFRPNVVIAGLEPYDEDHLDTIEANGVVLKLVKPCTRCVTTTTNQETAVRGVEPLPTLAEYRLDRMLDGVAFGMNAIVADGPGRTLEVGARVHCAFRF
jgi:uncharacterized protein YcbX